ncbi:MAG: hypothetical protein OXF48_06050, partial [Bacteroidetes bacterium]|nr:hypothetical protein [Bacteroidota bacterium]
MSKISTICDLVDAGLTRNSGIAASTKRQGTWTDTDVSTFRAHLNACAAGFYSLGVNPGQASTGSLLHHWKPK